MAEERIPFRGQDVEKLINNPETIDWDLLTKEERICLQNAILAELEEY
jgi:hypothetical protein